jgi:hypothetical protein
MTRYIVVGYLNEHETKTHRDTLINHIHKTDAH